MAQPSNSMLQHDIRVANHADLKPISRIFESNGHEYDEGLLLRALLLRQQAELRAAQRDGWVPPLAGLSTVLPCFAKAEEGAGGVKSEQKLTGALSATTSGLTAMDTDDGGSAVDLAAAAASQEERAAAAAAASAAHQLRREQRRAEKELRRQQLLQEKKAAKARARADARRRFADQQQRWEAAVGDKRQQVEELQQQVCSAAAACSGCSVCPYVRLSARLSAPEARTCCPLCPCPTQHSCVPCAPPVPHNIYSPLPLLPPRATMLPVPCAAAGGRGR